MNLINFFIEDNKSGYKSKPGWLKKNHPDLYYSIINNTTDDIPFQEKIYLYIHGLKNRPKCPECDEPVKFKNTLKRGYNKYCSIKCLNSSKYHKDKIKDNYQNKYGVDSHNQLLSVKTKKRETLLNKYGVTNPMKSPEIQNKYAISLENKYGVVNPMHIPEIIENKRNKIFCGEEKNIKRVINKHIENLTFVEHKDGNFKFMCNICNKIFTIDSNLLNSRYINDNKICLNCNPKKSYLTLPLLLINSFQDENIIINDRKLLEGREVDIYLPDHNLGIEINGLYWHSELFKDENYHINKTNDCENKDLLLLHIFEDEIKFKLNIVKSIINSKLNIFENKFFARKCEIKEIYNNNIIRNFLETNHLQGFVGSKVKIGLFYNDELLSLMTFGKKRIALGNKVKNNNEYEMLRFCNKLNTQVIGGASKLLKYFIKKYQPKSILTFADRRYGNGNLYKQLGFKFIENTKPNYYYFKVNEMVRHHRFKFRKDVLVRNGFNSNKTEREIMFELGYLRIYDSGNKKFIFQN